MSTYEDGIRDAARIAASFSVKPDRSLHPDVPWDQMNETTKHVAHATAQSIADEILELLEGDDYKS